VLCWVVSGAACPVAVAAIQSVVPPALPGPPPGAGSGLPLPPPPGQDPAIPPSGPATTIPAQVSGPGLLSSSGRLLGTRVSLQIACDSGGRVTVSAAAAGMGTLAQTRYACSNHRATLRLSLNKAAARRVAHAGAVLVQLRFVQGKKTTTLPLTLDPGVEAPSFWSDGGLLCSAPGSSGAALVAPNFTVTPPTTIDVRPWVAWYTPASGWRWMGVDGLGSSSWYRWTATPTGIAEWMTSSGRIVPWRWAPIGFPTGEGTYAIGVFEAVYWYSRPTYVWSYARSSPALNVFTTYCNYP
jgi:hypothetical protein